MKKKTHTITGPVCAYIVPPREIQASTLEELFPSKPGRTSPVPSLSSSFTASSNNSSNFDAFLDFPLEPPAGLGGEDTVQLQNPDATTVTPFAWDHFFPEVSADQTMPEQAMPYTFTHDELNNPVFAVTPPMPQTAKDNVNPTEPYAFPFAMQNLDMPQIPGAEYWDNLLDTCIPEEDPSQLEEDIKFYNQTWAELNREPRPPQEDWTSWSEWTLPYIETFGTTAEA